VAEVAEDKFTLISKKGKREYHLLVESGRYDIEGQPASLRVSGEAGSEPTAQPGAAADPPEAARR
jgi:hypothetical protein